MCEQESHKGVILTWVNDELVAYLALDATVNIICFNTGLIGQAVFKDVKYTPKAAFFQGNTHLNESNKAIKKYKRMYINKLSPFEKKCDKCLQISQCH